MTYVCAWCNGTLPYSNSDGSTRVSHGICPPCVVKHFPQVADEFRSLQASGGLTALGAGA